MIKRLMTAFFGVIILVPFAIFSHTNAVLILTVLMSCIGVYEILKCIGREKNIFMLVLVEGLAVATQLLSRLISDDRDYLAVFMMMTVVLIVFMMSAAVFTAGKPLVSQPMGEQENGKVGLRCYRITVNEAVTVAIMSVYVCFGFSSLVLLRDLEHGLILFLLWFFIPWVCDGCAYFVGRAFGKHKLIPAVSPKKTIEGAIGGVVGTLILMMIFALVMQFGFGYVPNYIGILLLTLVSCPVSMCGDLIASLLKREHNVKDYGNLLPGHGGVMDRFDSCISTGPFIYIVCVLFSSNALFF